MEETNPLRTNRIDRYHHRGQSHEAMHNSFPVPVEQRAQIAAIDALTHAVRALDLSVERIGILLGQKL